MDAGPTVRDLSGANLAVLTGAGAFERRLGEPTASGTKVGVGALRHRGLQTAELPVEVGDRGVGSVLHPRANEGRKQHRGPGGRHDEQDQLTHGRRRSLGGR